ALAALQELPGLAEVLARSRGVASLEVGPPEEQLEPRIALDVGARRFQGGDRLGVAARELRGGQREARVTIARIALAPLARAARRVVQRTAEGAQPHRAAPLPERPRGDDAVAEQRRLAGLRAQLVQRAAQRPQ